ncbi:LPS translocon maturation chaperone LptM [Halovibrio sp. HP20-50]|nr:lipoprotein [Halovibrio sp. HP20-59]MEA2120171.1 lipoprotein [Halovibrio sp. HP20-59]
MKTLASMALLALLLTAVAGCGQKGPLYMPDDEVATEQSNPSAN